MDRQRGQVSQELQPASASGSRLPSMNFRTGANIPPVVDRTADVLIPQTAWENWIPHDGPRQLRRPLRDFEREALERRRDELAPAVAPYDRRQGTADWDRVALAVTDMFGGFTSMRQSGAEAAARAEGAMRALQPFPAWAIEKACEEIHRNGVFREGKYDKQWAPSDAEIAAVTREKLRLFGDCYNSAVALLAATVAE